MGSEGQVALCGLVNGMLKLVAPCCPVGMRGGGGLIEESGHPTKKIKILPIYFTAHFTGRISFEYKISGHAIF